MGPVRPAWLGTNAARTLQASEEAPPEKRKQFFLMHADFEEKHGLSRHCYSVYERAAKAVPQEERAEVYRLFADRAQKLSGIPKVREVYQMACEAEPPHELSDKDVLALSLEFITIECRLQEIDRARCAPPPSTRRPWRAEHAVGATALVHAILDR